MNNELTVVGPRKLTPQIWSMIEQIAPVIYESRMFGVGSISAAASIMLKGYELGLGFTASFEFIQVIQGKPGLSPRGALAILQASPEIVKLDIRRVEHDGKFVGYECTMERKNGFAYTGRFTMVDAQKAGLIKPNSVWISYPENMCMWRAIGFAADVVAPDITAGMTGVMKMPEQLGVALDQEGNVIDAAFSLTPAARNAPGAVVEAPGVIPEFTLEQIVDMFGAEAVMTANGGTIPMDQAQIDAAALKLAGV